MVDLRSLEQCRGNGEVCRDDGTFLWEADYNLRVLQAIHDGRSEPAPRRGRIEGRVGIDARRTDVIRSPLTLHLEDGRRFDFFYADNAGTIAGRSGRGLYRPEAL